MSVRLIFSFTVEGGYDIVSYFEAEKPGEFIQQADANWPQVLEPR